MLSLGTFKLKLEKPRRDRATTEGRNIILDIQECYRLKRKHQKVWFCCCFGFRKLSNKMADQMSNDIAADMG